MFASFTVLSACVAAVFAATGNSDALVPSDISKTCSDFLNQLDGDSNMATCTSSLISSTSAYGPGGNATGTQSGISDTLTTFCGSSTSNTCPDSLIRSTLASFQTACSDELASNPNDAVVRMYDVLYALTPLRKAICTKGDDGSWCISKSSANLNGGTAPSGAAKVDLVVQNEDFSKYLFVQPVTAKRDESNAMYPNTTTFCNNNLIFDFLSASLPHDTLCTTCTRNILNSYVSFEKSQPYAPGLGQSQLLCGQADLMTGVKTTCGDNFLDDSANGVQAAGGISNNGPVGGTSAAVPSSVANLKAVIGAFAGAITFTLFAMN